MAHENNAVVNTEPREQVAKPRTTTLRDGLREQVAVVNQAEKENITNTITVDETKKIVKDAIKGDNEEELKEYCVVHTFASGTTLTQKIFDSIKSGDIIRVGDDAFVVKKSATTIRGSLLDTTINRVTGKFLNWSFTSTLLINTYSYEASRLLLHKVTFPIKNTNYEINFVSTAATIKLFGAFLLGNIASYVSMKIGSTAYYLEKVETASALAQELTIIYRDFSDMGTVLTITGILSPSITDTVTEL